MATDILGVPVKTDYDSRHRLLAVAPPENELDGVVTHLARAADIDAVARLARAADIGVDVRDAYCADGLWDNAPLIIVDRGAVRGCVRSGLPRRPGVILMGHGSADEIHTDAVVLGAGHVIHMPEAEPWLVRLFVNVARHFACRP